MSAIAPTLTQLREMTTIDVPTAAAVLGISRNKAYEAVQRGEIPILRIGTRMVVPVPRLLALLGADAE